MLVKVAKGVTRTLRDGAFEALRALHSVGFVLGDARLPNLLWRTSSLVWIDMREATDGASAFPAALQRADARTLAASLLALADADAAMPADVEATISRVPARGAGDDDPYRLLARAVWGVLRP